MRTISVNNTKQRIKIINVKGLQPARFLQPTDFMVMDGYIDGLMSIIEREFGDPFDFFMSKDRALYYSVYNIHFYARIINQYRKEGKELMIYIESIDGFGKKTPSQKKKMREYAEKVCKENNIRIIEFNSEIIIAPNELMK